MEKKKYETRRVDTDHRTHPVRKTQIEFKKQCDYCETWYWAKSRKSKFCSNNCRLLNYKDNQTREEVIQALKKMEAAKLQKQKEENFHKKRPQTKPKLTIPKKSTTKTKKK